MVNILRGIFRIRTKKYSELSETIQDKISEFIRRFFPNKSNTVIKPKEIGAIVISFEEIKQLVLNIKFFSYFERHNVEHIFSNLSFI